MYSIFGLDLHTNIYWGSFIKGGKSLPIVCSLRDEKKSKEREGDSLQATANRRAPHRSKSNRAANCLLLKRHLATSDWISLLFSHPFVCQRGLEKKKSHAYLLHRPERTVKIATGTVNSSFIIELRGFKIMITAYEKSRTNCVVGSSPEVVALRSKMGCAIGFNILSKQRAKRKRKRYYYLQPQKINPGKTPKNSQVFSYTVYIWQWNP